MNPIFFGLYQINLKIQKGIANEKIKTTDIKYSEFKFVN